MSTERLVLSEKYKAFLRCDAPVEFLEGTTAAGKTTVGLFKFMCKVAESPKKLHILAADDTGTAEKNIINKDLGILDDFGILAEYKGNGSGEYKMPHILFHTSSGDKIIFVIGYGTKSKWKDALGGQYGCLSVSYTHLIFEQWDSGVLKTLLVLPTGCGKTCLLYTSRPCRLYVLQ